MARGAGPWWHSVVIHTVVIIFAYGHAIANGVLLADDGVLRDIDEALRSPRNPVRMSRWGWPG